MLKHCFSDFPGCNVVIGVKQALSVTSRLVYTHPPYHVFGFELIGWLLKSIPGKECLNVQYVVQLYLLGQEN